MGATFESTPLAFCNKFTPPVKLRAQDYPCPASGKMLEVCSWYFQFVSENPAPPKSLAGDLTGGTPAWHGPDQEIVAACEANRTRGAGRHRKKFHRKLMAIFEVLLNVMKKLNFL